MDRKEWLGRFPQGIAGRDAALPEMALIKTTDAQRKAAGDVGFGVLMEPKAIPAGTKPYKDLKGGR
jgi:hypothetical protein